MRGAILAAGVGSRLRPLTNSKPKCLVKVCGKTLLDYQLDAYRKADIKKIFIIAGYEAEKIIEHCKHIKDLDITIVVSKEYESTNNMYSLYLLKKHLKNHAFILNNADLAIDVDIINKMVLSKNTDLIAVDTSQYNEESMKISVDNGTVTNIAKTIPEKESYGCSVDYYKFSSETSKKLYDHIDEVIEIEKDRNQWTEVAIQNLLKNRIIDMNPLEIGDIRWTEVDNYKDLELADYIFSDFDKTLSSIDTFFLDLDGTLYVGDEKIEGSDKFVTQLQKENKNVYFLSNNSSKDKIQYVKKLQNMGIDANEKNIILSTDGLVHHLKKNEVKNVFVLGTKALKRLINEAGISTIEEGDKNSTPPEFIVVGYDTELTYKKLAQACIYINSGVDILATHPDVVCPTPNGPIPDIGSMLEMIRLTTNKNPVKIFGKPNKDMIEHIIKRDSLDKEKTVIIGDRMYTDLKLAKSSGIKSILVLSGETKRDHVETLKVYPDFYVPSVNSLIT